MLNLTALYLPKILKPSIFISKEIQQSLTKLCKIPHQNEEQIVFMAEHLLGQCTALTEAMNRKHKSPFSRK